MVQEGAAHWRRLGAEFGGRKKFHGPNFLMTIFTNKVPFYRPKFLTFFSHRLFCLSFVCLYCLKSDTTYMTLFLTKNKTINSSLTPFFYSVRTLPRIR